jgi:hypothetical protein
MAREIFNDNCFFLQHKINPARTGSVINGSSINTRFQLYLFILKGSKITVPYEVIRSKKICE